MPGQLLFRSATEEELEPIVAMLADDMLGAQRESPSTAQRYRAAFRAISDDPNQQLVVAELDGALAGTLQLSYLPGLSYAGRWRAQIEAVRVAREMRGQGVGQAMLQWAVEQARERGCVLVQLSTDQRRTDARRFYEALGFTASHHGMKLWLQM